MYYAISDNSCGGPFEDTIDCEKWANRVCNIGDVVRVIRIFGDFGPRFYGKFVCNGMRNFASWMKEV